MYSYYLWASLAGKLPEGTKPTWRQPGFYKEWVTRIQMMQFTAMLIQAAYDMKYPAPNYPSFTYHILFYYMMSMLALFGNFYVQSYLKGKAKRDGKTVSKKLK